VKEVALTVPQATAEIFLTAIKALPRREKEDIPGRIARGRRLRRSWRISLTAWRSRRNRGNRLGPFVTYC
jgi:hypothetical protein